ncbi:ATP-binding protein [Corallococcus exercitus]|uniref:ATP-binding protein n=1 Tax=Corallococcus exercitus TaxID=2316736 RepID=UPI0035D426AB
MYAAFSRLNYKPWYALAEFVDNSIQSFLANRERLRSGGRKARLTVRIQVEEDRIKVSDDAAGIRGEDFPRAFSPAQRPPDASGLSEFGLGMKAAACWFSKSWSVTTSALGEDVRRTIHFNVPEIVASGTEELAVDEEPENERAHYTHLVLENLHIKPKGRTIGKIKSHLASMYRRFLADGAVTILYNDEPLSYQQPEVMLAPWYREPGGPKKEWKKPIDIPLEGGRRVHGWAALRSTASVSEAGFAVFRRERLIQGSLDGAYRPEQIFHKGNHYVFQRLFGELLVEGFDVSHTKDGLQWDEWEESILEELRVQLDAAPLPLLQQAKGHRVRASERALEEGWGEKAVEEAATVVQQHVAPIVAEQLAAEPEVDPAPSELPAAELTARQATSFDVEHAQRVWRVELQLARDAGDPDWYSFSVKPSVTRGRPTLVTIRVNLAHPFSERYGLGDPDDLQPLLRMAAGLAIAEHTSVESGAHGVPTLRRNFNQLLKDALSKP